MKQFCSAAGEKQRKQNTSFVQSPANGKEVNMRAEEIPAACSAKPLKI